MEPMGNRFCFLSVTSKKIEKIAPFERFDITLYHEPMNGSFV